MFLQPTVGPVVRCLGDPVTRVEQVLQLDPITHVGAGRMVALYRGSTQLCPSITLAQTRVRRDETLRARTAGLLGGVVEVSLSSSTDSDAGDDRLRGKTSGQGNLRDRLSQEAVPRATDSLAHSAPAVVLSATSMPRYNPGRALQETQTQTERLASVSDRERSKGPPGGVGGVPLGHIKSTISDRPNGRKNTGVRILALIRQ